MTRRKTQTQRDYDADRERVPTAQLRVDEWCVEVMQVRSVAICDRLQPPPDHSWFLHMPAMLPTVQELAFAYAAWELSIHVQRTGTDQTTRDGAEFMADKILDWLVQARRYYVRPRTPRVYPCAGTRQCKRYQCNNPLCWNHEAIK